MHHPSLRKHLLFAVLALAIIIGDAYFSRRPARAGQASDTTSQPPPAQPTPPPAANHQLASLPFPSATEFTPPPAAETIQPAAIPAAGLAHDNLSATLKSIEADYQAMTQPILEKSAPVIAPEDRTQLAFLDQEKLADLGKVLSTDEVEVYQNTSDPSAAPRRR